MTHLNAQIVRLYDTVYDRAPDAEGLAFWNDATHRGLTMGDMADQFITVPEFASTYGQPDNASFVREMYSNVLDRPGEAEGMAFWTRVLNEGLADRGHIALEFSESPEHIAQMEKGKEAAPPVFIEMSAAAGNVSGTDARERYTGNDADNIFLGNGGDDIIFGFGGVDNLNGNHGNDTIVGGTGNDFLYGGAGDDVFVFGRVGDPRTPFVEFGGVDTIGDFRPGDRLLMDGFFADPRYNAYPADPETFAPGGILVQFLNYTSTLEAGNYGHVKLEHLGATDIDWVRDSIGYV